MISVSEDYGEELLATHDNEVQKMKQLYEDNRNMFEKVAKRQQLWEDYLAFEVSVFSVEKFLLCFQFKENHKKSQAFRR